MVQIGETAPAFELPGMVDGTAEPYCLADAVDRDHAVLLLFYPFDFSPVCTNELCAIRDAEWFQFTPSLEVWAASGDSVHAHRAFAEEYDLNFPLLSDSHGSVASAYDVCYDEWEGHEKVPQRAVLLVDADQRVRYRWTTDDAYEKPDFFPVRAAIEELAEEIDGIDAGAVDLSVEYEPGPDEAI